MACRFEVQQGLQSCASKHATFTFSCPKGTKLDQCSSRSALSKVIPGKRVAQCFAYDGYRWNEDVCKPSTWSGWCLLHQCLAEAVSWHKRIFWRISRVTQSFTPSMARKKRSHESHVPPWSGRNLEFHEDRWPRRLENCHKQTLQKSKRVLG